MQKSEATGKSRHQFRLLPTYNPEERSGLGCRPFWTGNPGPLLPCEVDDGMFFATLGGMDLYEIILDGQSMQFNCLPISLTGNDLLRSGVVDYAWQLCPGRQFWAVVANGELVSVTYLRNSGVVSYAHHRLGGDAKALACETLNYKGRDFLYLAVQRFINGELKTCVERASVGIEYKNNEFEQEYLDCFQVKKREFVITKVVPAVADTISFEDSLDYFRESRTIRLFFHSANANWPENPLSLGRPYWGELISRVGDLRTYKIYKDLKRLNIDRRMGKIQVSKYPNYNPQTEYNAQIFGFAGQVLGSEDDEVQLTGLLPSMDRKYIALYNSNLIDEDGNPLDYSAASRNIFEVVFVRENYGNLKTLGGDLVHIQDLEGVYGEWYLRAILDNVAYAVGKESEIYVNQDMTGKIRLDEKCFYSLDAASATSDRDYYAGSIISEGQAHGVSIYENLVGEVGGEVVREQVPIDNEREVFSSFYRDLGSLYFYFSTIDNLEVYNGDTLDITLDGIYFGKREVAENRIDLEDDLGDEGVKYAVVGYRYNGELKTLPIMGGSVLGSSHGSAGQIRQVLLSLYKSRGGRLGVNDEAGELVNYGGQDDPLFTGELKLFPDNSGINWKRAVKIGIVNKPSIKKKGIMR